MRRRRAILVLVVGTAVLAFFAALVPSAVEQGWSTLEQRWVTKGTSSGGENNTPQSAATGVAVEALNKLEVKGRAPKTGYSREEFGNGWSSINGCTTRNIILYRDIKDPLLEDGCIVASGLLDDPYTGKAIHYTRQDSSAVQIDHVVALSDAWQKGAQNLSREWREQLANDPLELLAVDRSANQAKGDGDAATWLPSNTSFRCHYIARQISVKKKYELWVTEAEKAAMLQILEKCPEQGLITQ